MSRTPQTCADCARRKIKCNKVIPCDQCEKRHVIQSIRGIAHICRRAEITHNAERNRPVDSVSPGALDAPAKHGRATRSDETPINEKILSLVVSLSEKVKQLESKLDAGASRKHVLAEEHVNHHVPSSQVERPAKRARPHEIVDLVRSAADEDSTSSPNTSDAEVEDAATVLEYLAWGRLKDSTLTSGLRNPPLTHVPEPAVLPDRDILNTAQGIGSGWNASPGTTIAESAMPESTHITQIQEKLPAKALVYILVDYHTEHLLFMHCAYHAPSLRYEMDHFYEEDQGIIGSNSASLQWASLLFAVICGSMTCANPRHAVEWGFQRDEQSVVAKRWYHASVECLNTARYQQYQNIYSVQAIASSTITAHTLGFSNTQSVNLAAAIRIAQALGLHRLGKSKSIPQEGDDESLKEFVKDELYRRIWQQLAAQDWFSTPFSETYCINPLHFNTRQPQHCDEETMRSLPFPKPSLVAFQNFFFRIAALMPALLDRCYETPSLSAKYEQVLRFDKVTRDLVLSQLPPYLYSQTPAEPAWPPWVTWARRTLSISAAHKIIMIHRRFLGMSFHDKRFDFTRRTCLAAAKTIIHEMKQEDTDANPIFWTDQAFSVAAGIILALDNFNRHDATTDHDENRQLVREVVAILSKSVYISSIAARGTRLLSELLAEDQRREHRGENGKGEPFDDSAASRKSERTLNVTAFVKKFCETEMPPVPEKSPIPAEHIPLWLQQENTYQPSSYQYTREVSMPADAGYQGYPTSTEQGHAPYDEGYSMPAHYRRQYANQDNPFSLVADNFDISSVTWFDDLLGLAPSHSI